MDCAFKCFMSNILHLFFAPVKRMKKFYIFILCQVNLNIPFLIRIFVNNAIYNSHICES